MVETELKDLIQQIHQQRCEGQTLEIKTASNACPAKLYDTLSSFSNQDSGGIIVFGLNEKNSFDEVGVYDAQDLQKKVMEYCEQMEPLVRPVFTVCTKDDKIFVSAEIPPIDVAERPCFYAAKGRLKGSYVRVGDADKPMSEYEVYSYEAFRKKYQDDIRPAERATLKTLDETALLSYLVRKRTDRPNLALLPLEQQYELTGIMREGNVTLAAALLFGIYPQAWYPQLCIIATCVPGITMGEVDADGNRFTDTRRIEGSIPDMLDAAMAFVRNNMRTATRIDAITGKRIDVPQYPMEAVREAILNALVHRDYSFHTEGMPVQLIMYTDRLEIINPGGLYGRLTIDQLGRTQPDTRNPVLVTAMETMGKTENRYSGIPTIRRAMAQQSLPEPIFQNTRATFKVVLCHAASSPGIQKQHTSTENDFLGADSKGLMEFCKTPRTRAEIMKYLGMDSGRYALRRYLEPLVQMGAISMTLPDKPSSPKQQYVTASES